MKSILSISVGSSSRDHIAEKEFLGQVCRLERRGLHMLVTTTPRLEGRSFGTNVMEATLLALTDKPQTEVTQADYLGLIERIRLEPEIEVLN